MKTMRLFLAVIISLSSNNLSDAFTSPNNIIDNRPTALRNKWWSSSSSSLPLRTSTSFHKQQNGRNVPFGTIQRRRSSGASGHGRLGPLFPIIDVPFGFFTIQGLGLGLVLSITKEIMRVRMEEIAWERRLSEGRERRLEEDPTLTELDLRREDAAKSSSVYGPRRRRDVTDDDEYDEDGYTTGRNYAMTDDEINDFEREFGIEYDPYYDDPYEEDELPTDVNYRTDRVHGDRMYEDGETFYKDEESGLYYRQGSKPRLKKFWNF